MFDSLIKVYIICIIKYLFYKEKYKNKSNN